MKTYFLLFLLIIAGCSKVPKVSPPVPPPVPSPTPQLNKTFGEVKFGGVATLLLRYKSITILVDPCLSPSGAGLGPATVSLKGMSSSQIKRTIPPGLQAPSFSSIDYMILTDTVPHHLNGMDMLRRDMKIVAPTKAVSFLNKVGFSQVRGMGPGQRVLLKKPDAFLFLSCCSSRNPVSGAQVNGYLLEFDNGRNLFISGEMMDESALRSFLYDLRDDGKEIHLAFFYGGGLRLASTGAFESWDEETLPAAISLLQPKVAYILQSNGLNVAVTDEKRLSERLKEEIYEGSLVIPAPGQILPF